MILTNIALFYPAFFFFSIPREFWPSFSVIALIHPPSTSQALSSFESNVEDQRYFGTRRKMCPQSPKSKGCFPRALILEFYSLEIK